MRRAVNFAGALRLATFASAICGLLLIGGLWRARALSDELLASGGEWLLREARAFQHDQSRTLVINGAPLRLNGGTTTQPVAAVLDSFESGCRDNSLSWPLLQPAFVLRDDGPGGGHAACFDAGEGESGLSHWRRSVQQFIASGDVTAFGALRVVFARRSSEQTHFVVLQSEGPLPVAALFPTAGDAPGADFQDLPRPPLGRRVLSGIQPGTQYGLAGYRSSLAPAALRERYARQLRHAGYVLHAAPDALARRGESLLWADGAERDALIVIAPRSGGGSLVALALLPYPSP